MKEKKLLYFECPTGVSGDMFLAALINLGVDIKKIKRELKKLPVSGYSVSVTKERRHAIEATRFKVKTKKERHHRTFGDIKGLIEESGLSDPIKKLAIKIFKLLAKAEGKVHGITPGKVHFHEVGAVDSIVDIVGAAIAIETLGKVEVYCSPIATGSGFVKTAHGTMPIPAPATLELLKGVPIVPSPVQMELTTPTGAAILKTLVLGFGPVPPMTVTDIGYGAGGKDFKEVPNVLRVTLGTSKGTRTRAVHDSESILAIETNTDDMNPQLAGYLMERLLAEGALEVFFTPVQMKKNRPGTLITVLAEASSRERLTEIIFRESTSIGVRYYHVERSCLERDFRKVRTAYGPVRIKVSRLNGRVVNVTPEYEDCKKAASGKKVPIKDVIEAARAAFK